MAFTRLSDVKEVGNDFTSFVEGQMALFNRQMGIRNADEESRFNNSVLTENLTLEEQLDWRKDQKVRVKGDKDETSRITAEIANLKDRIEQRKFSDEYLQKLTDFESGASSIDSIVSWLEEQKASTTDLNVQDKINVALREQKGKRFTIQKDILTNQTEFAVKDKSASVLSDHIARVKIQRNKASLSGDELLVSVYDLQLQSLEKASTENSIEKTVTNFAVNTITNGMNALSLLDAYNSEVGTANTEGSVTIGGNTFNNEKEFWNFRRAEYITNNTVDGFMNRFSNEKNQGMGLKTANGNLGMDEIRKVSEEFDRLKSREELKNFEFQIDVAKQGSIQAGTDFVANEIQSRFFKDFDVNKAVSELNNLKTLGGNVSAVFDTVIQKAAQNKTTQVNNILDAVNTALQNDPSLTAEQAIDQAIASGAGSILAPGELVTTPEEDIVKTQAKGAQEETFNNDPRTTTDPKDAVITPQAQPDAPDPETPPADVNTTPQDAESRFQFATQIDRGTSSDDVLELQRFLNKAGFNVAQSGAGSAGSETKFFGGLTEAALKKFQASQGIVSSGNAQSTGFGRLGPQTLAAINKFTF